MKKIEKVVMFCPFCEEDHTVDFVDNPEAEIVIDRQKIKYRSRHYECDKMPKGENSFTTGKWLDEELEAIREAKKRVNSNEALHTLKTIDKKVVFCPYCNKAHVCDLLLKNDNYISQIDNKGVSHREYFQSLLFCCDDTKKFFENEALACKNIKPAAEAGTRLAERVEKINNTFDM